MKSPGNTAIDSKYLILSAVSIAALAATFAASISNIAFSLKLAIFLVIVFCFLAIVAVLFLISGKQSETYVSSAQDNEIFTPEIEEKLLILEEAGEFFGASLKSGDMFRLVASRINEIVPHSACVLFITDAEKRTLNTVHARGEHSKSFKNLKIKTSDGLAGKAFQSQRIEIGNARETENSILAPDVTGELGSSIAVPLFSSQSVFGVLQLFRGSANDFDYKKTAALLEAIGERVSPLLTGSLAFEQSLSTALTDPLTDLPNERAFFLILENQIAESQRLPGKKQLTILLIDLSEFGELNQKYGHTTGDKILAFAARHIKSQLRQMDFLARSVNDEFFTVLPTASEEITKSVIERIERNFVLNPFQVTAEEKVYLKLNFGSSTFLKDGETAQQLLQTALLRKSQSKNDRSNKVIWFPKTYIN